MTSMRILQHVPHESADAIARQAAARGWAVRTARLWLGEPVPARTAAGEILVAMGGPMGVADIGDPRFPWLAAEAALIRRCLDARTPLLGICLGAQLIAHAAGAAVAPMRGPAGERIYEVGWGAVAPTPAGRADGLFGGLPDPLPVLHWHGDACAALPEDTAILAGSAACPVQAFRIGAAYGLQFHVEAGSDAIAAWVAADAAFVAAAGGPGHGARVLAAAATAGRQVAACGEIVISRLLDRLGAG